MGVGRVGGWEGGGEGGGGGEESTVATFCLMK